MLQKLWVNSMKEKIENLNSIESDLKELGLFHLAEEWAEAMSILPDLVPPSGQTKTNLFIIKE